MSFLFMRINVSCSDILIQMNDNLKIYFFDFVLHPPAHTSFPLVEVLSLLLCSILHM